MNFQGSTFFIFSITYHFVQRYMLGYTFLRSHEHEFPNSFKWRYALSESRPWTLGNSWITPSLILKFLTVAGIAIHGEAVVLVG